MKSVVQRVKQAEVVVDGLRVARIGKGILALVAISREDTKEDLLWMARKITELRIFNDGQGKLNLSLNEIGGQLLLVSQFTLYGDCKKGRRHEQSARPLVFVLFGHPPGQFTGNPFFLQVCCSW